MTVEKCLMQTRRVSSDANQSPPEPTLSGALNWKICWQSIKKGMEKQA